MSNANSAGRFLAMQDLQQMNGFGRTPVPPGSQTARADTLIVVLLDTGFQIAPIDLERKAYVAVRPGHRAFRRSARAERSGLRIVII